MPETPPQPKLKEQFVAETIPIGFPWRLFIFSLTLFIFSLFVFFGLRFGYEAYINQRTKELDGKIEDLIKQASPEEQKKFIDFYSQLVNLEKILNRHTFTANLFSFLEKNTLGEVYYNDAAFSAEDFSLNLQGIAASNQALIGQLSIFDSQPEVNRVQLNQMSTGKNQTNFGLTLFFNEEFFQKPSL